VVLKQKIPSNAALIKKNKIYFTGTKQSIFRDQK